MSLTILERLSDYYDSDENNKYIYCDYDLYDNNDIDIKYKFNTLQYRPIWSTKDEDERGNITTIIKTFK